MATSNAAAKRNCIPTDYWCVTKLKTTKISYLRKIENFSHCIKNGKLLESSSFPSNLKKGSTWNLNIRYPTTAFNSTYMSVFLKLVKSSAKEIKANYKIYLLANDGITASTILREDTSKFSENISKGFSQFIDSLTLHNPSTCLLLNDTLKLYCEITIIHEFVDFSSSLVESSLVESSLVESSTSILWKDFGHLLEESLFSDVILNVKGKQISAHKAILSARSPVFAAMFKNEMKESTLNEVDITDISHETMKNVLLFIYTGTVPNLETMAESLLSAADKYDLEHLKRKCEEILKPTITVENSCHLLLLADMHNANHLKSCAIDFINFCGSSVRNTDGWKNIISTAPHLFIELYCNLFE